MLIVDAILAATLKRHRRDRDAQVPCGVMARILIRSGHAVGRSQTSSHTRLNPGRVFTEESPCMSELARIQEVYNSAASDCEGVPGMHTSGQAYFRQVSPS